MTTERPRFSVTVSRKMYDEINRFQHENRISTQTKAIAQILQIGISCIFESMNETQKDIQCDQKMSKKIVKIFDICKALNSEGQLTLLNYAETLTYNPKYKKYNATAPDIIID